MHPITAATSYATRGWPVFPCDQRKRPKTPNGFKDATLDPDQIRTWWADDPDATIGVATGNGLVVIDVDSYKGSTEDFADFLRSHGGLPRTYTVTTGQGGTQLYFSTDEPVRSTTSLFPYVDVRGEGGYVIAPPSVTIFGEYLVQDYDLDRVAELPAWLAERMRKDRKEVERVTSTVVARSDLSDEDMARGNHYAQTVFDMELARLRECTAAAVQDYSRGGYSGPDWNQTVYEVACNLLEVSNSPWNDLTEEDAYRALLTTAPRDAGFGDSAIVERWDSARKKVGTLGRPQPKRQVGMFTPFTDTPSRGNVIVDPGQFFDAKTGLLTDVLAAEVQRYGELAIDSTTNRSIWAYRSGVWKHAPHEVNDRCARLLSHRYRPNQVTTVLGMIHQQLNDQGAVITCEPVKDYVNVQNGMLHWRTGALYRHDPSLYSTVQLPVEWDPDAVCPLFDRFVSQVMAPDAIAYLWEMLGYLVYSGNPLQRAFLFHGAGSNGKGTLIRVIKALLGEANTSSVTLQEIAEGKFEVASLFGKIANLAGDIDSGYLKSTAKFKAITGEDTISAQRKYEHSFQFTCWAVPVFSANEFWKTVDTTSGYKRRWQVLSFPNTFGTSSNLTDELTSELPGILAHAVRSLRDLMARGDFDTPQSAVIEKSRFELAGDQVQEWLEDDETVTVHDPSRIDVSTSVTYAYRAYVRWTQGTGNGQLPSSKWWQRMESLGFDKYKSGVMKIRGLAFAVLEGP